MYRILVADDEGIMLEAFKKCDIQYIWGQLYHRNCQDRKSSDRKKQKLFIRTLSLWTFICRESTGSRQCGKYEKSIRTALFYVVSAYDKFDYAKRRSILAWSVI